MAGSRASYLGGERRANVRGCEVNMGMVKRFGVDMLQRDGVRAPANAARGYAPSPITNKRPARAHLRVGERRERVRVVGHGGAGV